MHMKNEEHVLVVERDQIIHTPWHGLKQESLESYVAAVKDKGQFLPRSAMEVDPRYKQIIPYLIFTYENRYFLMQRQAHASETRLRNKLTLGIGGHIRQEDVHGTDIFEWAKREFHEEVSYDGSLQIEPLGIINDDTTEVGRVHIGFALLLRGDSGEIAVKSELKSGMLVTLDECKTQYENLEEWSKIVVDCL